MKKLIKQSPTWVQNTLAGLVLLMISFSTFAQGPGGGHHGGPGGGPCIGCPPPPGGGGPGGGGPHPPIGCNANFLQYRDSIVNGIQFINAPGSPARTFAWDFGDGSTSTSSNPSHVYADTGLYTVCLIVTDTIGGGCSDTSCHPVHVFTPAPHCNAHFGVRPDSIPNSVRFFSGRRGFGPGSTTATYSWDFGDGSTSTDPRPNHTYASAGVYYVCLTVSNTNAGGTCTDTWCDSVNTNFPPGPHGGHGPGHHHPRMSSDLSSDIANDVSVEIYPNPLVDNSTISIENTSGNVIFNVYNMTGQIAFSKQLGNGEFTISKENLTEGLYFYDVVDGNNSVAKGKFVVN